MFSPYWDALQEVNLAQIYWLEPLSTIPHESLAKALS
jgi:hypothetical protein